LGKQNVIDSSIQTQGRLPWKILDGDLDLVSTSGAINVYENMDEGTL
jgi:hypothetical protein